MIGGEGGGRKDLGIGFVVTRTLANLVLPVNREQIRSERLTLEAFETKFV